MTDLIVPTIRLHGMFSRAGEEIAKPAGQTLARWLALEEVADGPATVAQMARALGLARQSVQRVTDLLERDRLIEYSRNPEHQRAQLVRLTPDGRRAMHTIREAQRTWADAIAAQVGEAELRQAGSTVNRLLEVLAQLGPERSASRTGQPSLPTPATTSTRTRHLRRSQQDA